MNSVALITLHLIGFPGLAFLTSPIFPPTALSCPWLAIRALAPPFLFDFFLEASLSLAPKTHSYLSPLSWFHSVKSTPSLSITLSPLFSKRLQIYSNELDLNFSPQTRVRRQKMTATKISSILICHKVRSCPCKIAYIRCFHIHTHFNGSII